MGQLPSMGSNKNREDLDYEYADGYLRRLQDLDNPIPLSSPWLFPPRPDHIPHDEKEKLKAEYLASVKLSATSILESFPADSVSEVIPGKAWVVPRVLTEEECEEN